jgi:hypothetical protein
MMKLSDDRSTNLVKQINLPSYSYITTCREKIYQTNPNTKAVTCYTIKGEQLWEYKDESVLKDPRGVTIDNDVLLKVALSTISLSHPYISMQEQFSRTSFTFED